MNGKESELFAIRLVRLRNIEGLSQEALAKKLNISRSCLANYEGGRRWPDDQLMAAMAAYFKVSVEYLSGKIYARDTANAAPAINAALKDVISDGWLDISALEATQRTSISDYLEFLNATQQKEENPSF